MLKFRYVAKDSTSGQTIKATIEAESEQEAAKLIRKEGLSPVQITQESQVTGGLRDRFNRVKSKDRVLFSRQLSTLINAGLPLVQSLRNVADQTTNKKLRSVAEQVISDVEGGMTLSASFGKHPEVFNRVFVSLVAAGEASGTLDKALERIADQQEKDAEIISKVRGAMIYPIIVILVMIGVMGFMLTNVLPQVKVLYAGLPGAELPLITKVLLAISDFVIKFWWMILIALGIMIFFGTRYARTVGGRRIVDKVKLTVWPLGQLFQKMYMARFARTGTTLVSSGVPLIQMLEITGDAVNNVYVEDAIKRAADKVKGGKALSDSLAVEQQYFLSLVPNMIRIGEVSGSLENMLAKIADYYEKEVDNQVKSIQTIIEPVLMVVLGIVAFIIVAAVLLPVYGLAGKSFV
jgi:type IV pilus assembly protein PilC